MSEAAHLRLAGVTRLNIAGARPPHDAFVFDPHRLALPCWALALDEARVGAGAMLVTLDRHLDLVPPSDVAAIPPRSAGVRALDEHSRWALDVRNYDHVLAAVEAGLVGDAIVIARDRPKGAIAPWMYRDREGRDHRLQVARDVAGAARIDLGQGPVLLDVDLDCFTSPRPGDPLMIDPWPVQRIREFLLGPGTEAFWDAILPRSICLTFAREPYHCGGLVEAGRLFEAAAQVLFCELLGADLP